MANEVMREDQSEERPLRCDFCGRQVKSVRRIALDRGYDRLQKPHAEKYACEPCSQEKERERRGAAGG